MSLGLVGENPGNEVASLTALLDIGMDNKPTLPRILMS